MKEFNADTNDIKLNVVADGERAHLYLYRDGNCINAQMWAKREAPLTVQCSCNGFMGEFRHWHLAEVKDYMRETSKKFGRVFFKLWFGDVKVVGHYEAK